MFFVKGEHHELTSIVLVLLLLSSQKLVQAVTSIQPNRSVPALMQNRSNIYHIKLHGIVD